MANLTQLLQSFPIPTIRLFWINIGGYLLFILFHAVCLAMAKSDQSKDFHRLFIKLNFEIGLVFGGFILFVFLIFWLVIYEGRTIPAPHELQGGWVTTFNVMFCIFLGILAIIDIGMYFLEKSETQQKK